MPTVTTPYSGLTSMICAPAARNAESPVGLLSVTETYASTWPLSLRSRLPLPVAGRLSAPAWVVTDACASAGDASSASRGDSLSAVGPEIVAPVAGTAAASEVTTAPTIVPARMRVRVRKCMTPPRVRLRWSGLAYYRHSSGNTLSEPPTVRKRGNWDNGGETGLGHIRRKRAAPRPVSQMAGSVAN